MRPESENVYGKIGFGGTPKDRWSMLTARACGPWPALWPDYLIRLGGNTIGVRYSLTLTYLLFVPDLVCVSIAIDNQLSGLTTILI
jgi:hypothetical protein